MQLTVLLKKSVNTIMNEGIESFYIKAKNYVNKNKVIVDSITGNKPTWDCEEYLNSLFRNTQAIDNIVINDNDIKRINLVTDSIGRESLFGGVATAIIVVSVFANKYNYDLRIITRNSVPNPQDFYAVLDMNNISHPKSCTFFSDWNRDYKGTTSYKLEITENDIFFATSWWSAEAIRKTSLRSRFFYIIQEVETFFYPHGDEHLLCSQIMNNRNIDFIVNSHYLWDYFMLNNKIICDNGYYFEPAFSLNLFNKDNRIKNRKKKKLFFYSRPNNPRNLFYHGIKLLDNAIRKGILRTSLWDIYFVGQDVPDIVFCDGSKPIKLGILSWKEYSDFLKTVDLTLSLMYTPHPSYPPFDAACSGSVVLTNSYENKKVFEENKNVIVSTLDMESMMENMKKAVDLSEDEVQRTMNFNESKIARDWETTLTDTLKFMKGCL